MIDRSGSIRQMPGHFSTTLHPDLVHNDQLVVRLAGRYYNWHVAAPMLVSLLVFQQPLSEEALRSLAQEYMASPNGVPGVNSEDKCQSDSAQQTPRIITPDDGPGKGRTSDAARSTSYSSWFSWGRSSSVEPSADRSGALPVPKSNNLRSTTPDPAVMSKAMANLTVADQAVSLPTNVSYEAGKQDERGVYLSSDGESEDGKLPVRYRKSLRLTSAQLKSLPLVKGCNKIRFSVTTKYQGTTWCECDLYLWHWSDKLVISDIDGTITKSDVIGHIAPLVGGQWAQPGVTSLYQLSPAMDTDSSTCPLEP